MSARKSTCAKSGAKFTKQSTPAKSNVTPTQEIFHEGLGGTERSGVLTDRVAENFKLR